MKDRSAFAQYYVPLQQIVARLPHLVRDENNEDNIRNALGQLDRIIVELDGNTDREVEREHLNEMRDALVEWLRQGD